MADIEPAAVSPAPDSQAPSPELDGDSDSEIEPENHFLRNVYL